MERFNIMVAMLGGAFWSFLSGMFFVIYLYEKLLRMLFAAIAFLSISAFAGYMIFQTLNYV